MPKRPRQIARPENPESAPELALVARIAAALVVMRLLVPPEASAKEGTVWITTFWFLAGIVAVWAAVRAGLPRRRWDLLDTGVVLLVAGHVASALRLVILHDGDRRAAITMTWEWLSLGVSFLVLRTVLRGDDSRRGWAAVLIALASATAGYGLWQHYVWYPGVRQELRALDAAESASATSTPTPERRSTTSKLREQLAAQGIPLDGPARRQFEDRLQGSEPIGLFALTNTFAGWLATWLIVGLGWFVAVVRRRRLTIAAGMMGLSLGLVSFCLFLTKSRTAWVGLIVGLATLGLLSWRQGTTVSRRWLFTGAIAVAVMIAGFIAVAALSGGFDRAVVSQAPRSVKFRLQYWSGTLGVLKERWLWGTGPANFRPHYLRHKLPEASEEIADPHNFVLDLWASGGLLALIGGAIALAAIIRAIAQRTRADQSPPAAALSSRGAEADDDRTQAAGSSSTQGAQSRTLGASPPGASPLDASPAIGAACGFAILIGYAVVLSGDSTEALRLLAIGVGAVVVWKSITAAARDDEPSASPPWTAFAAAGVALLVHLLGAGGIEMPAIVETLLLLAAILVPAKMDTDANSASTPWRRRHRPFVAGGVLAMLFAACVGTAAMTASTRTTLLALADSDVLQRGDFTAARRKYAEAAAADPFSPEPVQRLAELEFRTWQPTRPDEESAFRRVVELQTLAIAQDPHNPHGHRRLGQMWWSRHLATRSADDANQAAEAFEEAARRYPASAAIRGELAQALAGAGQSEVAAREAQEALRLDDITRAEGHVDKQLSDDVRARLKSLMEGLPQ